MQGLLLEGAHESYCQLDIFDVLPYLMTDTQEKKNKL